jgi:tryptophan-rich sensory protein
MNEARSEPDPSPPSRGRRLAVLALLLAASAAVAAIGGRWTASSVEAWYPTLLKPAWTPPAWLFGPVWTVLYALMALAAWRVWLAGGWAANRPALSLYAVQLLLNLAWSGIFFGLRAPGWALIEIEVLWLAIALTTWLFFRRDEAAGWLMLPYLLWVTYAAALNAAISALN